MTKHITHIITTAVIATILGLTIGYTTGQQTAPLPDSAPHCTTTTSSQCRYYPDDKRPDQAGLDTYIDRTGTRWYRDDQNLYNATGW